MLKKETIAALAKAAGQSAEELAKAISSESEVDFEIKTSHFFTDEEWKTREASLDKEHKEKYDSGKEAGQEMVIKDLKIKEGLEFDGKKPEDFVKALRAKTLEDADKNPDKKVSELEKDLEKLRGEITQKDTSISDLNKQLKGVQIDSKISKYIPEKLPEGVTKEDALFIVKRNFEFEMEEGKEVVKKNGEVIKDKTRNPVSYENAIIEFATERKWRVADGGRGGDDGTKGGSTADPSKFRKMSDFNKYFDENDINPASQKAMGIVMEAQKAAKEAKEEFALDK